jgi:hypothetical protein
MKRIAVLLGLLATAVAFNFIGSRSESNSVAVDWMKLQQRLIRNTKGVPHVAYSRHFAYTSIAVYESIVQSDKNFISLTGQLQNFSVKTKAPQSLSYEASANSAFATMLKHFYGNDNVNAKIIDSLDQSITNRLVKKTSVNDVKSGAVYGKNIAASVIAWSDEDGSDNISTYNIPEGESLWVRTPPAFGNPAAPFWSKNRAMMPPAKVSLLKDPAVVFSSASESGFFKIAHEVYETSQTLTDDQKNIALFWDDSPNGKYLTVFGHWTSIFIQALEQKKLPLLETTVAMVKLSLSQHDAGIVCWEGKYKYNVMRPVTYINRYIDKSWSPLIETPPHPEYPAAHATLSAAAATALENVFGKNVKFSDNGYESIGFTARSYSSFEQAAREAGMSRVYGGIHYRTSVEAGHELGVKTAEHVLNGIKFSRQNP